MDLYSSGEDLRVKARKPYTITKQRERWTEDEHSRFLEALRLYGRAWQCIEEHIGTKTAVQIRSHAQKFFTKLEKEATVKGVPIGHTLDVEIPPPRPKRKPTNPYPRKTGTEVPTLHVAVKDKPSNPVSSSCQDKMILDLEKEPERPFDDGKLGNTDRCNEKDDCCEIFTLLRTPSSNAPRNLCTSKEYVLLPKEASNQDEATISHVTIEAKELQKNTTNKELFQDNCSFNKSNVVDSYLSHEKSMCGKSTNNVQASQNYPRHVPVHILHESLGITAPHNSQKSTALTESLSYQIGGVHGHQNPSMNPAASTNSDNHNLNAPISSIHQSFSSYHPIFTQLHNQNAYETFSSLILSTLLKNPAAHAATSFATTLSPYLNVEAPIEPPIGTAGPFQPKQINLTHNMAAIASATVAAATAWWAAHGLVPFFPPLHPSFNCSPPSAMVVNDERRENSPDPGLRAQKTETDCSKALHEQLSALKSPAFSLLDFEGSEGVKLNSGLATAEAGQVADEAKLHEASKCKNTKQVDRSSCGSNTPSSSEIEGDVLEKQENGNEENHMKNSWKEVSQEGRVAFRALFSTEVLPQSFSPTKYSADKGNNNTYKDNCTLTGQNVEEGLLSLGLSCGHAKVKSNRTGFIPYKRCSVEAKESRLSVNCLDEEKGAKRLRLKLRSST